MYKKFLILIAQFVANYVRLAEVEPKALREKVDELINLLREEGHKGFADEFSEWIALFRATKEERTAKKERFIELTEYLNLEEVVYYYRHLPNGETERASLYFD